MEKHDELMAVLLGEPAPRPGPDGTRETQGYGAAERDMAAVREQLRRIGDGLARAAAERCAPEEVPTAVSMPESVPMPEPVPVRRWWRGRLGLVALAAAVAVASLGTGAAYLVAHNGVEGDGPQALLTVEGLIACSSTVVEGTVERVEAAGGDDRYRVVLDVERYYKPASGERSITFVDQGANVPAYYRSGARMLVLVSSLPGEGPDTYRAGDPSYAEDRTGAAQDALEEGRLRIERALPAARGLTCEGGA
ncbi:hypothetical protein [Streptomyces canus]|uniref:hypothetical protein n=1 Tax=Streptomyces canus TaxID=58343 RepID=UPI001319B9EC|nr:hypothetical protein [Streptomyces canus]